MQRFAPTLSACVFVLGVLALWKGEWQGPFFGMVTFVFSVAAHLLVGDEIKDATGFKNLSSDAFGSFTTLMGLVFSILLGQTYQYYFDRQGAIQDASFREIGALSRLVELVLLLEPPIEVRRKALQILKSYALFIRSHGLSHEARLVHEHEELGSPPPSPERGAGSVTTTAAPVELHGVLKVLGASVVEQQAAHQITAAATLQAAHHALRDIDDARAVRVSNINADLPHAQWLTLNLLGLLLTSSFLLLDLQAPKLEACLFGAICATAQVFSYVIADLSDPFHGFWSVGAASSEVETLERKINSAWRGALGQSFAQGAARLLQRSGS